MGDKRVLVTGASSGIGRACALGLAKTGGIVFAGVRNPADGDALRGEAAGDVRPVRLDVTSTESIREALAVIGDAPLAGLVNNAGIVVAGPLELRSVADWRRQFEVNVLGLVAVTQACLPRLRAGGGRIVNIGSIGGRMALPGLGAYAASKFAVRAISDALRLELRPLGVTVSLIEPGAIDTPIWGKTEKDADAGITDPAIEATYAPLLTKLREEANKTARGAAPASLVAEVVERALTAPRPRARYIVGADARVQAVLAMLPDRWRDALILSRLSGAPAPTR